MPIVTVSKKGWIVIPAEIRKRYNIKPGDKMVIVDYAGEITMAPAEKDPVEAIRKGWGMIKDPGMMEAFMEERRKEFEREERKLGRWPEAE